MTFINISPVFGILYLTMVFMAPELKGTLTVGLKDHEAFPYLRDKRKQTVVRAKMYETKAYPLCIPISVKCLVDSPRRRHHGRDEDQVRTLMVSFGIERLTVRTDYYLFMNHRDLPSSSTLNSSRFNNVEVASVSKEIPTQGYPSVVMHVPHGCLRQISCKAPEMVYHYSKQKGESSRI